MVSIDDDFLSLLDDKGSIRNDLKLPDSDLGNEIRTRVDNEEDIAVGLIVTVLVHFHVLITCLVF